MLVCHLSTLCAVHCVCTMYIVHRPGERHISIDGDSSRPMPLNRKFIRKKFCLVISTLYASDLHCKCRFVGCRW